MQEELFAKLEVGQTVEGTVKNVTEYIADPDFILAYAHNVLEDALRCAVPVPSEEAQEAPPELFS